MGTLRLPASGEVYLDASAVIFSVEKIDPYWTILQPLWHAAQTGQFTLISSQLLLLEVLVQALTKWGYSPGNNFPELTSPLS